MRFHYAPLAFIALAACATPAERIVTKEVQVPVPVRCVDEIPAKPEYETEKSSPDDKLFDLAKAFAIERRQLRSEVAELRAKLEACR